MESVQTIRCHQVRTSGMGRRALAGIVAVVAFGACSSNGEEASTGPRVEGTSPTAPGLSATEDQVDLPADQVVWQADTKGGFVSAAVAANDMPEVTIYGDGQIFVRSSPELQTAWQVPPAVETNRGFIPPDELREFLDDVAASGLVDDSVDYGRPGVTDLGNTVVRFHGAGAPETIDVDGLSYAAGRLSKTQIETRREVEELIERSRDLVDETEPWAPDRVDVTKLRGVHSLPPPPEETAPWFGSPFSHLFGPTVVDDDPDTTTCVELSGANATAVHAAATGSAKSFVDDSGEKRLVVVRALLPGEASCVES